MLDLIPLSDGAIMLVSKADSAKALAWILPVTGAFAVHSRDGYFDIFHERSNAIIAAIRACHGRKPLRRAA